MTPNNPLCYGQVHEFLMLLGFQHASSPTMRRIYRHPPTGLMVLLANRDDDAAVSAPDLAMLHRNLNSWSIGDQQSIDSFFQSSHQLIGGRVA